MSRKPFEELHLMKLLRDFDTSLALSYLQRVKLVTQLAEAKGVSGILNPIEDGVLVDPVAFRVALREPTFVMLSHPICRLRKKVPYPKQIEWERYFVAHLGMVPIYLVNLNVITVLKLWGFEESVQVVSKPFEEELAKGDLLLEFSQSFRPPQYSSMNFVLPFGSSMHKAPDELLSSFQKYYRYLFWADPGKGYTFSSHFLHGRAKITSFMKITKSLYTVRSVGRTHRLNIEGRLIDCRELNLLGFVIMGTEVRTVSGIRAFVPSDVAEDFEKSDIAKCFLNAMLIELRSELGRVNLLSNIVEIGESSFDLATTLLGMQVTQACNWSDRPSYVCSADDLHKNTVQLMKQLFRHIGLPTTVSDIVDNFQLALCTLHPFLLADGSRILFTHPMIIGFLARQRKLNILDLDKGKSLVDLLNLFEKIRDTKREMEVFLDPRLDQFRGEDKKATMNELFSIERRIRLYKCLYQAFNEVVIA